MDALFTLIAFSPYISFALLGSIAVVLFTFFFLHKPKLWLFFVLIGMFLLPVLGESGGGSLGAVLRQIVFIGLFVYSVYYSFFYLEKRFVIPSQTFPPELIVFIIFLAFSMAWSPDFTTSFKRYIQVVGVLFVSLMFSFLMIREKSFQTVLVTPVLFFLFSGYMMMLLQPSYAFDIDGAFKGLAAHKNTWGQFSLLASILTLILCCYAKDKRFWYFIAFMISIVSLVLSKSTTSLFVLLIILVVVLSRLLFLNFKNVYFVSVLLLIMLFSTMIHVYFVFTAELPFEFIISKVFEGAGKNTSLTGRTYLWELMFNEIYRHLWFGTGYGGFWLDKVGASTVLVSHLNWGPPTQAHSGYIDVLNEIGVVGSLLFVTVMIFHAIRLKKLLSRDPQSMALMFYVSIFISVVLLNISETSYLKTTHLWWILLCMSIVDVHYRYKNLYCKKCD